MQFVRVAGGVPIGCTAPVGDENGVRVTANVGVNVSGVLDGKNGVGVGSLPPLRLHASEASSSAATTITGFFISRICDFPPAVNS
jgi:hypothetical protein